MTRLISIFADKRTRIATIFALLISLTFFLFPAEGWQYSLEKFIPFAGALISWLFAEITQYSKSHPADVHLYGIIDRIFDENQLWFLRHHEFHGAYQSERTDKLIELETWKGPRYEFQSQSIQKYWKKLQDSNRELVLHLAVSGSPHSKYPDQMTLNERMGRIDLGASEDDELAIEKANVLASELARTWEQFERKVRAEFGFSYTVEIG